MIQRMKTDRPRSTPHRPRDAQQVPAEDRTHIVLAISSAQQSLHDRRDLLRFDHPDAGVIAHAGWEGADILLQVLVEFLPIEYIIKSDANMRRTHFLHYIVEVPNESLIGAIVRAEIDADAAQTHHPARRGAGEDRLIADVARMIVHRTGVGVRENHGPRRISHDVERSLRSRM